MVKKSKKLLAVLMAVIMLLSVTPLANAFAADVVASGTCGADGDNLIWVLNSEGTLTISGTGAMKDYFYGSPWYSNKDLIKSVVIESGMTRIGDYAFGYCSSLTSVTIPDSVTSIGDKTFYECSSLTSITIGVSVANIGEEVFWGCGSLTSINVDKDNGCYSSADGVLFSKDKTELIQYPVGNSRTIYVIPNAVKSIVRYAFWDCSSLEEVTIGKNVEYMGNEVFYFDDNLRTVNWNAENVKYVGVSQFEKSLGCENEIEVIFGDEVRSIPDISYSTFGNPINITSITIGKNVEEISSFSNANKLKMIIVDNENNNFCSEDNILYNKDKTEIFFSTKDKNEIIIPDSVKSIREFAFYNCQELKSIYIPNSVENIGNYSVGYISLYADDFSLRCRNSKIEDFVIYGVTDSEAEAYANKNGFEFVDSNHAHTYTSEITIPATCTETGIMTYTCSYCGDTYTEILFGGHVLTNWKIIKPATPDEPGVQERYCYLCDYTERETFTTENVIYSENTDIYVEFGDEFDGKDDVHVVTEAFADENVDVWAWNITIMSGDAEIQPNGYVTVKIPIPDWCPEDGYTLEDYDIYHYGIEPMNAVVIDGYFVFRTNSFSEFKLNRDENTTKCSCNCHKSGVSNFFWKIINFFHKLFKMEKYHYCDCGNAHW